MIPEQELRSLVELADLAGLTIRPIPAGKGSEDVALQSGICRVKGDVWVVLAGGDPLEDQISVLAEALRTHRAEFLEGQFLPPQLRERLGG